MPRKYELGATCSNATCNDPIQAKGLCRRHYAAMKRAEPTDDKPRCTKEGCDEPQKAKGLCNAHYSATRRVVLAETGPRCSFEGCDRPLHTADLCGGHYRQRWEGRPLTELRVWDKYGDTCTLKGCGRNHHAVGLCGTHYFRKQRGEEDWDREIKDKAPDGAGHTTKEGYRLIYVDGKKMFEHIHEFEKVYGRQVRTDLGENVHHCNGCRSANNTDGPPTLRADGKLRSGNLELWSSKQPKGQEIGPKLDWAREILAMYGTDQEREAYAHLSPLNERIEP